MLIIAYLHYIKKAIFGPILLIMWVGGFKNGKKYAYVIKVRPLAVATKPVNFELF